MSVDQQTQYGAVGNEYLLREEQIREFHEQGYVVLDDVLTEEELTPIEEVYQLFMEGGVPDMGRDFCDMSGPYTRAFEDFQIVNAVLPRVYRPDLQGNIYELRAASISRQLLGDDATLDYDQFLAKRPKKGGAQFAWHQDLGYWPSTPQFDTLTATCSLALDDAKDDNGCLQVVPGSHKEPRLRPHRPMIKASTVGNEREESHTLAVQLEDSDERVSLPVKRGSVSVHNERILHGSPGNGSERWRRTYIIAYRHKDLVDYERSVGFTHSHNDKISWTTHLEALEA
ncbi:Phytanoyl-CoA dioxygenase (PhyH) [Posidoniimonas polymericola]|uniref:Phytanoyl-CoA dioxygenase (PhyH) n=1 Tax=Posidoniimonas polymericola TaxID=2528002 RepID=A0A5C5YMI7_9BACT|nr:phytanoyl-CoA dioxygenase family protein [Posidoniimonas polymericola]TWT75978.1 Phytanoyl-CoA dioxygenase (PhyH) [Posidoniimonas polymericola]